MSGHVNRGWSRPSSLLLLAPLFGAMPAFGQVAAPTPPALPDVPHPDGDEPPSRTTGAPAAPPAQTDGDPASEPATAPPAESETTLELPPRFGDRGELVISGFSRLGISSQKFNNSPASYFSATFAPGFDYFVARGLSLGATVNVTYIDDKGYDAAGSFNESKTTQVSVAPRLGYNVPLGDSFSWYPRLAFGWTTTHVTNVQLIAAPADPALSSPTGHTSGPWFDLFAPFLFHPAPHFFLGAGPGVSHTFVDVTPVALPNSGQPTEVYGELVVGGWWGGRPADDERTAPSPGPHDESKGPAHHFGDESQLVFSNETAIFVSTTHDSGSGSSSDVSVSPGFDYFVARNVALGANVYATYGKTSQFDYQGSTTTWGGALHASFNVPLGDTFSIHPRGYIGVGRETHNSTESPQGSTSLSQAVTWVALYVPVLVHPAPHLFFGFGPTVQHELADDYTFSGGATGSNKGTSVGASLIVGGWL